MNRSEAIDEVIGYIDRIESEWGNSRSTDSEAIEVLTALGVTRAELVEHGVVRDGHWYRSYANVLALIAGAVPYDEVAREVANSLNYSHPIDGPLRQQIFGNLTAGRYEE